jgi:hypothetical protein
MAGGKPQGRRFTEEDDQRLSEIMSRLNTRRLRPNDWRQIQQDLNRPFTIEQIRHRWFNFLRPPLSRAEFTKEDRKEALRLYMDTPNNWKEIASRFGDGSSRSPEMMENLLKTLNRKLVRFGLNVEIRDDVDLIPDDFFNRGFPSAPERIELVHLFDQAKGMLRALQFCPPHLRHVALQAVYRQGTP